MQSHRGRYDAAKAKEQDEETKARKAKERARQQRKQREKVKQGSPVSARATLSTTKMRGAPRQTASLSTSVASAGKTAFRSFFAARTEAQLEQEAPTVSAPPVREDFLVRSLIG